jgi:hypothetical protein
MGSHPLNLVVRFVLELSALAAIGYWGWTQHEGLGRWLWAIGVPLVAAALWGTFAVRDDPSRSGRAPVPTPGVLRLLLELGFFAAAAIALVDSQRVTLGLVLAAVTLVHYAASYDRVLWLLKR